MEIEKKTTIELEKAKISPYFEMILMKKEMRRRKKEYMISGWTCTIILMVMAGAMFWNASSPTITFVKNLNDADKTLHITNSDDQTLYGFYNPMLNHMWVSTEGLGDSYYTTLHEYAHYIYYKKLTKEERKEWDTQLCQYDFPDYDEMYNGWKERCSEHFAVNMAHYIQLEGFHTTFHENWKPYPKLFEFAAKIYKEYY